MKRGRPRASEGSQQQSKRELALGITDGRGSYREWVAVRLAACRRAHGGLRTARAGLGGGRLIKEPA